MPMMLLGWKQDALIPYSELESLGARCGSHTSCHYETLSSPYGHDAFLKEFTDINHRIRVMIEAESNPVSALRQWISHASH